ncbi:MAG TPA: hypothetical protein VMV49_12340 [Candidatus Deferrimicrobium sp.]|nr:hypothetical protein [Candidatus Deferrimicrobium sp.]
MIYHTGYMDAIIDTVAEILQNPFIGEKIISNIQILLEGFLEPGNKAASISVLLQKRLIEAFRKKFDRKTVKKINKELEFTFALT